MAPAPSSEIPLALRPSNFDGAGEGLVPYPSTLLGQSTSFSREPFPLEIEPSTFEVHTHTFERDSPHACGWRLYL
jgi:hypothetical protein